MKKRRILSLLLAILMIFTVATQLIACGDTNTDTSSDTETDEGNGTNTESNVPAPEAGKVNYTVNIKSKGGMPLEGVKVYVADKDGNFSKNSIGTTGANGTAIITLPQSNDYQIFLEDAPEGYMVEDSYKMEATGKNIVLESAPIMDGAAGARYELGDIIHNYTVTVDGVKYTFADILKEKDAIVLNFWFTTCNYCISEFPEMEASYAKYKDKIALFALNGKLGGDSAADVEGFKKAFHYAYSDYSTLKVALKSNELTIAIGNSISYEVLSQEKINEGFDATLNLIAGASDMGAKADEIAKAIEDALLQEDDTALKAALQTFANDLKDVDVADEAALLNVFAKAKGEVYNSFALKIPMTKDENDIESCFGITGNPVTIVIDRYGMISFMHTGEIPNEKYFDSLFNYFTLPDATYKQNIFNGIGELTPTEKPNVEAPSNEKYNEILNKKGAEITFSPETNPDDAEYSWPFIEAEKNGVVCVKPSNYDKDQSYAILRTKVTLKAGEAVMFDYFASSQYGYDVMYVIVEDQDIYTISGQSSKWNECCPWVAKKDGVYDVSLVYQKDYADYEGEDTVYVSNFRVVDKDEVGVESFIPREAATDLTEDASDFENYVEVVLGDDGYYHVGEKNGPILLANLLGYTNFSRETTVTIDIQETDSLIINGVNYYNDLIQYCNYASNSQIYGFCSVTPTLRRYLEAYVDQKIGVGEGNPNQWLTLCSYYDAYGTDGKQLEDPIKGLTSFSAYEVKYDKESSIANKVEFNRVIMPRGLFYKFTPTESGVYRFTTNSDEEVTGWIFVGDHDAWVKNGDRILYTHSDVGERHCNELLIDPDGDGTYERDFTNASMVAYMEAGKDYYINFAYYDQYQFGTFTFDVKWLGESYAHFVEASPGLFTTEDEEMQGDVIAGGIKVVLGDDGYYHHDLGNGKLGSILYADFYQTTSIFTQQSIQMICDIGGFNFAITEVDQEAISLLNNYTVDELREKWGEKFETNWKYYQMDDIIDEKYHGYVVDGEYFSSGYVYITDFDTGETIMELQKAPLGAELAPDYTALIEKYEELVHNSETEFVERQGCVAVTKELAEALQMLMDKFTFEGVENSWTKLCYYYNYLGTAE